MKCGFPYISRCLFLLLSRFLSEHFNSAILDYSYFYINTYHMSGGVFTPLKGNRMRMYEAVPLNLQAAVCVNTSDCDRAGSLLFTTSSFLSG